MIFLGKDLHRHLNVKFMQTNNKDKIWIISWLIFDVPNPQLSNWSDSYINDFRENFKIPY